MGLYRVRCEGCGTGLYDADTPPADAEALLRVFADAQCPIGGTAAGCPSTTDAAAERRERDPGRLPEILTALRGRVTTLERRAPQIVHAAWPIPALDAGTRDVALDWGATLANAPDPGNCVIITELPVGSEGAVTATVTATSPSGATLTVTTSRAITAGGHITVLAAGWAATA